MGEPPGEREKLSLGRPSMSSQITRHQLQENPGIHNETYSEEDASSDQKTCDPVAPITQMGQRDFMRFRELVQGHTGIYLRDGKQAMLASRLSRSVRTLGLKNFDAYFRYLADCPKDSAEFREFINSVTTNKTSFFREPHHFEFLRNTIVPELKTAASRGGSRRVRVWSAASSTGEEAYSIAITLLEALPDGSWNIDVLGSDIDTSVLRTAQRAIYPEETLGGIDLEARGRHFLRGEGAMMGRVKVKPEVTSIVEFRRVNLMDAKWHIEGTFDAIFFRNALIYFQPETQNLFLRKMLRHLRPGGYLFLGNAEYISSLHDVLEPLHRTTFRMREPQSWTVAD